MQEVPIDVDLLPVPDVRQHDHYACGAAASMAVGKLHKVGPKTLEEWKSALGTTLAKSTDPKRIVAFFQSLRCPVEQQDNLTLDDLTDYWVRGWPVIVPVQDYGSRRQAGASFAYGHYLVVIGCGHGYVFCQDSSEDNVIEAQAESIQEPGKVLIQAQKFLDAWHDQGEDGAKYFQYGIAVGPPQAAGKPTGSARPGVKGGAPQTKTQQPLQPALHGLH